ncbi:MAG TPA: L-histidine N(alpha)-methyltransferase [Longimicrobiales bacterium]|nr:L-histidine N(alpha)-methyltransferase [Longimicrobiales bacterium]
MTEAGRTIAEGCPWPGMAEEVRESLLRSPPELSPKFFYDRRGSELFERITRLPAYYLTDAEIRILQGPARRWVRDEAPRSLVELGAGSARKTRILLDALEAGGARATYVPVDVSREFLDASARRLRREYPDLRVEPVAADISTDLELDVELERPAVFALLGSTIGNFEPPRDRELLERVAGLAATGDAFLLGADLRPGPGKSRARVLEAYDDPEGVTAAFNRNVLRVLNRWLGTEFDPEAFRHRAVYDDARHRIEIWLEAERPQESRLPDGTALRIAEGEGIRTEVSCKYDRGTVEALFGSAGFDLQEWWLDPRRLYAMAVGRKLEPS